MSRLLFIALIIIVVYWLLKSFRRQAPKDEGIPAAQAEDMVRCAQCGVHLPKRESILSGGSYYCSEDHRRAHVGKS